MWCVQALAAKPEVQLQLWSDSVDKPCELTIDFEHWYLVTMRRKELEFRVEQRQILAAVKAEINSMPDEEFHSEGRLCSGRHWRELRTLARRALVELGWPDNPPPYGRNLYAPTDVVEEFACYQGDRDQDFRPWHHPQQAKPAVCPKWIREDLNRRGVHVLAVNQASLFGWRTRKGRRCRSAKPVTCLGHRESEQSGMGTSWVLDRVRKVIIGMAGR
jgi:hypothetical protein